MPTKSIDEGELLRSGVKGKVCCTYMVELMQKQWKESSGKRVGLWRNYLKSHLEAQFFKRKLFSLQVVQYCVLNVKVWNVRSKKIGSQRWAMVDLQQESAAAPSDCEASWHHAAFYRKRLSTQHSFIAINCSFSLIISIKEWLSCAWCQTQTSKAAESDHTDHIFAEKHTAADRSNSAEKGGLNPSQRCFYGKPCEEMCLWWN